MKYYVDNKDRGKCNFKNTKKGKGKEFQNLMHVQSQNTGTEMSKQSGLNKTNL